MSTTPFKLTIHMVASLDGFIAKKDNSVSWFETEDYYEKGVTLTEDDKAAFLKKIDCYVMGARTYEHAMQLSKSYGWVYGEVPVIAVTHSTQPTGNKHVTFFSGNLHTLVHEKLKPHYKNVWVAGGALLAREFIRLKLADEISLSVLPVLLGEGVPFFDHSIQEQALHLQHVTAYKNGMVELCYEIKK